MIRLKEVIRPDFYDEREGNIYLTYFGDCVKRGMKKCNDKYSKIDTVDWSSVFSLWVSAGSNTDTMSSKGSFSEPALINSLWYVLAINHRYWQINSPKSVNDFISATCVYLVWPV